MGSPIIQYRTWNRRIGVMLGAGLISQLCTGLAFSSPMAAVQSAPASVSMPDSPGERMPSLEEAPIGQSQSVAPSPTPKGISPEAWTRMRAQVEAQPYVAHPDPHHRGAWLADNAAQRLAVRFTRDAVSFTSQANTSTFQVRTRIGDALTQSVPPTAAGNRVEYRHEFYTEWYVNDVKGFEQGWTLDKRIGASAPHIGITVSGARTVAEGDESVRIA